MNGPIVRISTGLIRGAVKKATNGNLFYSFEGIPFAEPPVGKLRFKAPVPAKQWEGVRGAQSKALPCCYVEKHFRQIKEKSHNKKEFDISGSEDCLYLNVFTPSLPPDTDKLKPVMVFIHGGGYVSGGTQKYGPEVFLSEDVVLVTVSYRLGALGFLAIDNPKLGATGNAGLKDMVLALKWSKQNAKAFNGDPDNISIIGESAGGSSAHFLVLSPTTKGLFHKAIIQSGSALCYWANGNPQNGLTLAKYLGCSSTKDESVLRYLQDAPVEELLRGQAGIPDKMLPSTARPFVPVVENIDAEDAFLYEHPIDLMLSGNYNHVPMIFGYNNDEGALFGLPMFRDDYTSASSIVPRCLDLEPGGDSHSKVAEKIRAFYLKNGDGKTERGAISEAGKKLNGDAAFVRPVIQSARIHAKNSEKPIYLYRLSVVTKLAYITGGNSKGVCHADGLGYQFLLPNTPKVSVGSIEDVSRTRIVKMFTNFAREGHPNSKDLNELSPNKWKPIENGVVSLLDIGQELTMVTDPEAESMALWDHIFDRHAKHY